jgi:hypothetical protein
MLDARMQTKLLLARTQGMFCPICLHQPVSDLHEIIYPKGIARGGKYDLEDEFGLAVYAPGNCILLCNTCNVSVANSISIDKMLALKMSLPGVKPEDVVQAARNVASFSKIPRRWCPSTVTYNQVTYHIL